MRKIIFIILAVTIHISLFAQTFSEVGKISLSVVMPENVDGLDKSQLSKLETKIIQIASMSGMSATGYNNNFVIYPKFAVYETNIVEGGMQNIVVSTYELSLFIKQVDNNILFASISKTLKGSGNNKSTALTNALSKINSTDIELKEFIDRGKNKIIQYYESRCDDIILKAESLVKKHDFEEALGLLLSVPDEVKCYNRIQSKSVEVYKSYQNQKCTVQLQDVNVSLASNDFTRALESLRQIDPSAVCFKEAQSILNKIIPKISAEQKKNYDLQLRMYNDQISLEKLRINSAKEVAAAYYRSKPSTILYNYIVR